VSDKDYSLIIKNLPRPFGRSSQQFGRVYVANTSRNKILKHY